MTSTLQQTEARMRAVVKTGAGAEAVRVSDVSVPAVDEGLVRVRVTATGICGTDVHVAHDQYAHEAPVVMGHEIAGIVDTVGEGVDEVWLGARGRLRDLVLCVRSLPLVQGGASQPLLAAAFARLV